MSLLIKALDKAQEKAQLAKGKQAQVEKQMQTNADVENRVAQKPTFVDQAYAAPKAHTSAKSEKIAAANALEMELSLSPKLALKDSHIVKNNVDDTVDDPTKNNPINAPKSQSFESKSADSKSPAFNNQSSAQSAANVFSAKRIEADNQNTKLALIAAVGVLALLAIGAYYYQFMDNTPDTLAVKRAALLPPQAAVLPSQPSAQVAINVQPMTQALPELEINNSQIIEPKNRLTLIDKSAEKAVKTGSQADALRLTESEVTLGEATAELPLKKLLSQSKQIESNTVELEEIASKSVSMKVSKSKTQVSVSPVLMSAYDAYNAGNDIEATKLYKQVLQRDVRNVDALLGLGAIAQRQGRVLDENGWYGKVLELEPRNSIARAFTLAYILESQPQTDVVNSESRLKSLLEKQPDDANLHAALGNFYADLSQWSAAQSAYFEAYRLNASADNAYNLAISLDQLGKSKLALPYYQRALQLAQSTNSNLDKAALQARITAIQ